MPSKTSKTSKTSTTGSTPKQPRRRRGPGRPATAPKGTELILTPCRFNSEDEYDLVLAALTPQERAEVLVAAAQQKQQGQAALEARTQE